MEKFNDIPIADLNEFDYPTGKVLFASASGRTKCWIDERGKLVINRPMLSSLGVVDIKDLKSQQVWHHDGLHSPQIIIFDDSFLEITFDHEGQIHHSNSFGISATMNGDGEMIIYKNHADPHAYCLFDGLTAKDPYYVRHTKQTMDTRLAQHVSNGRAVGGKTEIRSLVGSQGSLTYTQSKGAEQAFSEKFKTKTGFPGNVIEPINTSRTDARGASHVQHYNEHKKTLGSGCG